MQGFPQRGVVEVKGFSLKPIERLIGVAVMRLHAAFLLP